MLKSSLTTMQRHVEHWLFPAACVLCGKAGADNRELCADCLVDLPYNDVACLQCASPLSLQTPAENLCGRCQHTPPAYDRAFSVFHYTHPVAQLIQRLKFNARLNMARLLGELMADHFQKTLVTLPQLIIPVPLHPSRLRGRGFNQALELARPAARKLGIAVDYRNCVRTRRTAVQSTLPAKDKRANVKDAFGVIRPLRAHHVAIVDDVMTTGHTLDEVARVLRKAGVERIDVWVLARAAWRS